MYSEYKTAFDEAETHLKNAETFVGTINNNGSADSFYQGLLFPAVNELRYAGYHIAQATSESGDDQIKSIKKAVNHCHRACYDALDAQIQYCINRCFVFKDDYRKVVISHVLPGYNDECVRLDDINEELKNTNNKEERWRKIKTYLADVQSIHKKWDRSRDELNKMLEEKRNARFYQVVVISVGTVAAIAAIATFFCK